MKKERPPMDCYRALTIFRALFYGGFACVTLSLLLGRSFAPLLYVFGWLGIIGMLGGLAFGFLVVRCSCCGKALVIGRLPGIPKFCPDCGTQLKEE